MNNTAEDKYLGKIYPTNSHGNVIVVGYEGYKKVLVQFEDGTKTYCRTGDLLNGEVRNPNFPSIYGIGFLGQGPHKHGGKDAGRAYRCWRGMFNRCYDEKYQKSKPTYIGCSVDPQWYNFQEFAEWCQWQVGFKEGWHLDKDILHRGNKVYSPENCVFVPNEINCLLNFQKNSRGEYPIGVTFTANGKYRAQWQEDGKQQYSKVLTNYMDAYYIYKENKERVVKSVAARWKGVVDERVYLTLMQFEVSIDD